MLNKDGVLDLAALKKKKFSKKTSKSFGGSKKNLTFASAFRKKAIKKSSLKDLDMNKQVPRKNTIYREALILLKEL